MLAFCALALALVGPRYAALPGPDATPQFGFTQAPQASLIGTYRWNGVHRLDGDGFPRLVSKPTTLGHQKMGKILDAGIGPELAPASSYIYGGEHARSVDRVPYVSHDGEVVHMLIVDVRARFFESNRRPHKLVGQLHDDHDVDIV